MTTASAGFAFDNTLAETLDGFAVEAQAAAFPKPELLRLNEPLARELGLDVHALRGGSGAAFLSGAEVPEGAAPVAQVYAGHQFGGFSPQLGDGRALLLGEVVDQNGRRRDVQLKGSGPTPFSRGGDGKATLGSVLREYLIGEAMHGLGIPTSRALAVVTTGEPVFRERPVPGAVLTRVAASHLRVGTFEFFAAQGAHGHVRRLADYAIARHYPECADASRPYVAFMGEVARAQAELVARWMHVGFIHGVMNTDNVAISGETIDYGPCAFMDTFHPLTVFSSIDTRGRYAYGRQPVVARWNIARFAEALLPILDDDPDRGVEAANEILEGFVDVYQAAWLAGARDKLGLTRPEDDDLALVEALLELASEHQADYTSTFRGLSRALRGRPNAVAMLLGGADAFEPWRERWMTRLRRESRPVAVVADDMDRVNPIYIPRNHLTEAALTAAVDDGDLRRFDALLQAVTRPFEERAELGEHAEPAPADFYPYRTFCGT